MTIREIVDYGDPQTVCDGIGMETKRAGKNTYIRCPSHERVLGHADRNISNAVLTKKGFHCFACGTSGDWLRMAADFWGMPYDSWQNKMDVAKRVADEVYPELVPLIKKRGRDNQKPFILTHKELEAIGLRSRVDVSPSESMPEGFHISIGDEMEADPIGISCMIMGKVLEKKQEADKVLSYSVSDLRQAYPTLWSKLRIKALEMEEITSEIIRKMQAYLKTKRLDYEFICSLL